MGATKLMTAAGGGITLDAASTATDKTITVPAVTDTMVTRTTNVNSGTAVASTSGTSIDFTGIPSWVKRITVMLNGVSTNGTSNLQVQIGSGSVTSSGYTSGSWNSSGVFATSTTGYLVYFGNAANNILGMMTLCNMGSNLWVQNHTVAVTTNSATAAGAGSVTLAGTLDRVRITTVGGTDTFDAGSINILYE